MSSNEHAKLYFNILKQENDKKIVDLENQIESLRQQNLDLDFQFKEKNYSTIMNLFFETFIRPIKNQS